MICVPIEFISIRNFSQLWKKEQFNYLFLSMVRAIELVNCIFYDSMAFWWREGEKVAAALFYKPQSFRFHHHLSSVLSATWCCCGLSHNLTLFHGWYFRSICKTFMHFCTARSPLFSILDLCCGKKSQFKSFYSPSFFSSLFFIFRNSFWLVFCILCSVMLCFIWATNTYNCK